MEDGVNFDYGGPLGCGEEGEKRRESTAGRNQSERSLIFPFMVKLASRKGETKLQGADSHSTTRCCSKL